MIISTTVFGNFKVKQLSQLQILLFGFSMLLGNCSTNWNSGIDIYGLTVLWFNLIFSASGVLCLCLCCAEMYSAFPFSGGVFGLARASVSSFFGFMVACTEFLFCLSSISLKAQRFLSAERGQVIVIVMFGFCLVVNLIGGKPVFALMSFLGFSIALMMLIYLFGTLSAVGTDAVSYNHYAPSSVEFTWTNVMCARSAVSDLFSSIQYLTLLSDLMRGPKKDLPRLWLVSLFTLLFMTVFVILAAVSQNPAASSLQSASFPLQGGFARIFDVKDITQMKWIDFAFQFGSIFSLFYCAGKQLLALSQSGLLPSIFNKLLRGSDSPFVCYSFTAMVGICMNLYFVYCPDYLAEIKAASTVLSLSIFISCLLSYFMFRRKFSSVARCFVNPLGNFAAGYGVIVFTFSLVAEVFYNPQVNKMFIVGIVSYWIFYAIFFLTYLIHYQRFSEEEQKIMFKAYLMNANRKKRLNLWKSNKVIATHGVHSDYGDRVNSQSSAGCNAITVVVPHNTAEEV